MNPPLFDLHGDPLATGTPADAAVPYATDSPRAQQRPLRDLLLGVRRRWHAIALALPVLGVVLHLAIDRKFKPTYRAEATIGVAPTLPHLAYTGEDWRAESIVSFYDDYVRTLVARFRERPLLEEVVAELQTQGVHWLPTGIDEPVAPDHLRSRLDVARVVDTHLIAVGFESSEPELVAPVVNTVVDRFLDSVHQDARNRHQGRIEALQGERLRLQARLGELHAQLDEIADDLGGALLDERKNLFYERLNTLEGGRTKVLVERARAEGQLAGAELRAARLVIDEDLSVAEQLDADTTVREARSTLLRVRREVTDRILGLSAEHPTRIREEARLEAARTHATEVEEATRSRLVAARRAERREQAGQLLADTEGLATSARKSETQIHEMVAAARADLRAYGRAMYEGEQLRTEIQTLMQNISRIDTAIEEERVELHAPQRVQLRAPAIAPPGPASDKRTKMLALAVVGALGALIGLAFWLERRKPRCHDPASIRHLRLPTIAHSTLHERCAELALRLSESGSQRLIVAPACDAAQTSAHEFANRFRDFLEHDAARYTVADGGPVPTLGSEVPLLEALELARSRSRGQLPSELQGPVIVDITPPQQGIVAHTLAACTEKTELAVVLVARQGIDLTKDLESARAALANAGLTCAGIVLYPAGSESRASKCPRRRAA